MTVAVFACAVAAATSGIGAVAHPIGHHHPIARTTQTLTVSSDVEFSPPVRDAEVTVVAPPSSRWIKPAVGDLRDGFGPRPDAPVAGVSAFHRGQDVGAPCGAPVRAAAAGRVVTAGWNGNYGNWVLIDHGDGVETGYAHTSRLLVSAGERVRAGDEVAEVGSTGASSGCHLHFETHMRGQAVDPISFMSERDVRLGE
jgi:murein DD-endopeptidase MepM/ murein hydrolase activator NlpD